MPEPALQRLDLGQVRELRLDNPSHRNALTDGLLRKLDEALSQAVADGVRCILLRGEGAQAFSSGYDITALANTPREESAPDALLVDVLRRLEDLSIPVVAFINGPAFGGGLDLAAACDLRIAISGVKLGMPPARLGIAYSAEGLTRFAGLMGQGRARLLFFSSESLTSEQALAAGLVDEIAPPDGAEARVMALCQTIAANAPLAISLMRKTFAAIAQRQTVALDSALETARRETFSSEDAREGLSAFLEKRAPRFIGR